MISLCGKIFTLYFKQYLLTISECVLFYIGISHLCGSIQCFRYQTCPCWICYDCVQFQIEIRKISRSGCRFQNNLEIGHSIQFFYKGRQGNVPRIIMHTHSHCSAFVWWRSRCSLPCVLRKVARLRKADASVLCRPTHGWCVSPVSRHVGSVTADAQLIERLEEANALEVCRPTRR